MEDQYKIQKKMFIHNEKLSPIIFRKVLTVKLTKVKLLLFVKI